MSSLKFWWTETPQPQAAKQLFGTAPSRTSTRRSFRETQRDQAKSARGPKSQGLDAENDT